MGKDGKSVGKTLLTIGGFFLGAGAAGQGFFGANSFISGLYGASLASTLWSTFNPPKTDNVDQNYSRFDAIQNTVSSEAMIPIIYGKRKWGGNQTYHKASTDKTSLTKDIILCEGEIDSISDVRVNDIGLTLGAPWDEVVHHPAYRPGKDMEMIPAWDETVHHPGAWSISGCSYEFHNGASTQAPPSNYETVGGYKNNAWLRGNLTVSEQLQGGNPTITSVVKGTKVLTWKNNTWNKEWSDNPSFCLLDFLVNRRYGLGKWITWDMIDLDSFRESADYCAQLVTTKVPTTLATYDAVQAQITALQQSLNGNVSESARTNIDNEIIRLQQHLIDIQVNPVTYTLEVSPRYTLNIIIDQKKDAMEHLSDILSNFAGFLVFTNNRLALRIEKATPVSFNFDDSNIIKDSVVFNGIPSENRPNKFILGFFDPGNNWTQVKCQVEDTVDQRERGKTVKKEITLAGCTNQSQVLRLGRLFRDLSRLCPNTINFSTTTFAMHLEPGDVVTITQTTMLNGVPTVYLDKQPVRILEISKKNGTWDIKAQQYNDSIYNDALGAEIQIKDYTPLPNPFSDAVPSPASVISAEYGWQNIDGTHVSNIDISWDTVNYMFFSSYIIGVSEDNVTWKNYATTANNFRLPQVQIGKTYHIKVQTQNTVQRLSDAAVSTVTIAGKDNPPGDVTGFSVVQTGNNISFTWNKSVEPDIKLYELRMGSSWSNSQLVTQVSSSPYLWSAPGNGTLNFWVKAVDNFGNYSANATEKSINIFGLAAKNVILDFTDVLDTAVIQGMYRSPYGSLEVQTNETIGSGGFFADMFVTPVTYVSNASVDLAPIDLGYGIIDESNYYANPWGDLNIMSQETIGTGVNFAGMFDTAVTPVDAKAIAETYVTVLNKYNPRADNAIDVEYSVSLDNHNYSSKVSQLQKQFTGRYLQVSLHPTGASLDLKSTEVIVDVPDIEFTMENIAIGATKTHIAFPKKLLTIPSVALFVCDSDGQMAIWKTTNVDNNGFYLELFSLQGTAIAGTLVKAIIRGY